MDVFDKSRHANSWELRTRLMPFRGCLSTRARTHVEFTKRMTCCSAVCALKDRMQRLVGDAYVTR